MFCASTSADNAENSDFIASRACSRTASFSAPLRRSASSSARSAASACCAFDSDPRILPSSADAESAARFASCARRSDAIAHVIAAAAATTANTRRVNNICVAVYYAPHP